MSGGPDSLALLFLAAENRDRLLRLGFSLRAATVDHALRAESAAESAAVERLCREIGLSHATLVWRGPKPAGNLSAEARNARYRLLAAHAQAVGAPAVLTAHHEDDQIETHRLAARRSAGDRGLAGMRHARALSPGVFLLRPFLAVPGAALKAAVAERELAAADDPTNRDLRFERARLRARLGGALGRDERRAVLADIEAHAARRDAEDGELAARLRDLRRTGALAVDGCGAVLLRADAFHVMEPPVADVLLGRILRAAGGAEHPPSRAAVRRMRERLGDPAFQGGTLGHARAARRGATLSFFREYGRRGLPALDVSGAVTALFDRRIRVFGRAGERFAPGCRLAAFGATGRGNAVERALPVLLDPAGEALAAHPALLAKLPETVAALGVSEEVSFRLEADLPGL